MTNKSILYVLFTILGVVIFLFSTGSSILTKSVCDIPVGNILIWFGFMALQLIVYITNRGFKKSRSRVGKWIRALMICLMSVSVLWFGIAYLLSGNTSFNFSSTATTYSGSPKASVLYWYIIYVLVIAPVALMLIYNVLLFFEFRKTRQ